MLDWAVAEEQLYTVEKAYKEIGWEGSFALTLTINPLIRRFEAGERTVDLYDEIMSVKL